MASLDEAVQAILKDGVGLSDPMVSRGRRERLDLIKRLQNTG
jgi:hypothetical protein